MTVYDPLHSTMQTRHPVRGMFLYEYYSLRRSLFFVISLIVVPSLTLIGIKLFFDAALSFGFRREFTAVQQHLDLGALPLGMVYAEYSQPEYGFVIEELRQQILKDNAEQNSLRNIASYSPDKLVTRLTPVSTQTANQAAKAADDLNATMRAQALRLTNVSQAEYDAADRIPVLFAIQFVVNGSDFTYNISYDQKLFDRLNPLKNDSYDLFSYVNRYRNPLGIQLQIYMDNAVLALTGSQPLRVITQYYPNKQLSLNDPYITAHSVMQLSFISLSICVCCFIARDRSKQQAALRLLSLDELSFWFVRFISGLILAGLAGLLLGLTATYIGIVPFSKVDIGVSVVSMTIIGIFQVPFIIFISVIFGQNGPIMPIVTVLTIGILLNFVSELLIYIIFQALNSNDQSIMPNIIFYLLSFLFPNFNAINILDTLRINTMKINGQLPFSSAFAPIIQLSCSNQTKCFSYDLVTTSIIIVLFVFNNFFFFASSIFISFVKPEKQFPGVNPFKLIKGPRNGNELCYFQNCCISYPSNFKKKIIAVEHFTVNFNNIQNNINNQQVRLGLLGVSGAGKTSIMSVISGQIIPSGDQISILGYNAKQKEDLYRLRKEVSLCPQTNDNIIHNLTVIENLNITLTIQGFDKKYQNFNNDNNFSKQSRITNLLQSIQLYEQQNKQTEQLSGGMRRRLSLSNTIIANHKLFVFDEISSGLDPYTCQQINREIMKLQQPYILSTHDMKQVEQLCNYIILMKYGAITCQGVQKSIQFQYPVVSIILSYNKQTFCYESLKNLLNEYYTAQDYVILIVTHQQLKIQIINVQQQLQQLLESLELLEEQKKILNVSLQKGNLVDIFIKLATTENENNENIINHKNEIVKPDIGKNRTLRGLLYLFTSDERSNSIFKIPFAFLFLLLTVAVTGISVFVYNFVNKFVQQKKESMLQLEQAAQTASCLQCCGITTISPTYQVSNIYNFIINNCKNMLCFSDGYPTIIQPGVCLILNLRETGIYPSGITKKVGPNIAHDYYNTGIYENQELRIFSSSNLQYDISSHIDSDNVSSYQCLYCTAICEIGCQYQTDQQHCSKDCNNILQSNETLKLTPCSGSCENKSKLDRLLSQYVKKPQFNTMLQQEYDLQQSPLQLNATILQSSVEINITRRIAQQSIQSFIYDQQSKIIITSYLPNLKGLMGIYSSFQQRSNYRQKKTNNQTIYNYYPNQPEFWNENLYFQNKSNFTFNSQQSNVNEFLVTEFANSRGYALKSQPFDSISSDINNISNQILSKKQMQKSLNIPPENILQNTKSINIEAQNTPFIVDKYESTTFSKYIAFVQIMLLSSCFSIPILRAAIFFTHLRQTSMLNMFEIHGLKVVSIYCCYILYVAVYSTIASAVVTIFAFYLNIAQAIAHPVLVFFYLIEISLENCVIGMVIAQISKDKKHAAFIASFIIVLSGFITLFLMETHFILLILPQLFSSHRLMYLTHTMQNEWFNLLVGVIISIIYLFQIVSGSKNKFDIVSGKSGLFWYEIMNDIVISDNNENKHVNNEDFDLNVQQLNVVLGNTKILKSVSFHLQKNSVLALLGLSGSGKSVTLQTLIKQIQYQSGQIHVRAQQYQNIKLLKSNIIAYVPQFDILEDNLTIKQHVTIFALIHGHKTLIYMNETVQQLGLLPHLEKKVRQLSGGMKRRLSFLLALSHCQSSLIAFDECSTGLSPDLKIVVWNLINVIKEKYVKSCIITTHYMDEVNSLANSMVVLLNGEVAINNQEQKIKIKQDKFVITENQINKFNESVKWSSIVQIYGQKLWITTSRDIDDIFLELYQNLM